MPRDEDDDRPLFEGRNPAEENEPLARRRARDEYEEDRPRRRRRNRQGDATSGLIPYKNGKALASYYTGVFGLIPCIGGILGPIAIVLGFLGLGHASRYPEAKGKAHAIVGIVLGLIETLLYLVGPIVYAVIIAINQK
jgi:hypothetical protein